MPDAVYRRRVEWADTDASGVYHNTTVIRFVEAAEAQLMRELGIEFAAWAPRVHYEVDFLAPLRFGDEAVTTVRVVAVGRSSVRFEFDVCHAEGTVAARGSYVVVHVDAYDGTSSPWPDRWRAALTREDA